MPNNWFQFKQFRIDQSDVSFKVGTDGCLLGAWADVSNAHRILDIGTGSGLIALMLAQRTESEVQITGIDIDKNTISTSQQNFQSSPFNERLTGICSSLQSFSPKHGFDHFVCNPPFFSQSTPHSNHRLHQSRHEDTLTLNTLFTHTYALSKESSKLSMIIPINRLNDALEASHVSGWNMERKTSIRPTPSKEVNRVLLAFSREVTSAVLAEEVYLYTESKSYSTWAKQLLKDYYLYIDEKS